MSTRIARLAMVGLVMMGMCVSVSCRSADPPSDRASVRERTYRKLDEVRCEKRAQLQEYLGRIRRLAGAISCDPDMLEAFALRLRFHQLSASQPAPPEARRSLERLTRRIADHFFEHYCEFRDILFVSTDGDIFHTVTHPRRTGTNLFEGPLSDTPLADRLRERPAEAFVDYDDSVFADGPSAFFVEPAEVDQRLAGWFLLQCSIHKINDIFVRDRALGRSGEVFLVNSDCQMLTESRFRRDSSILDLHLSPENIRGKFAEGAGRKIVTDYRGFRALTSFEVCPVLDSQWLLIAKIDEAEAITDHFLRNRDRLRGPLLEVLASQGPIRADPAEPPSDAITVHLDEFMKARPGESLITYGVRTCTGVVIHLPGRFAYMGHASIYDAIYGGGNVDLVSHMLKRIRTYEICPYQQRQLQVVVIAPHGQSVGRAVDKLLRAGLFLSQIRVLRDDRARSGTVWHDVDTGQTTVRWSFTDGHPATCQQASEAVTLGDLAKEIVNY